MERQLITDYERVIDEVIAGLDHSNHDLAVADRADPRADPRLRPHRARASGGGQGAQPNCWPPSALRPRSATRRSGVLSNQRDEADGRLLQADTRRRDWLSAACSRPRDAGGNGGG